MDLSNVIAFRANKTIYRDGDTVVKVFGEGFKKAEVLNEALNHARVEETALNVPELFGVGMTSDCKWYIMTEYIPGQTLAELMAQNPKKHAQYLEQFVDLQLLMHRQICPLLPRLRDKMDRKIIQTELPTATKYDLHTRLESMPRHNKLCHGDFNPTTSSSFGTTARRLSSTGRTRRRATPARTRRAHSCSLRSRGTIRPQRATSSSSAKRAARRGSMCKNGSPSSRPASPSRVSRRSGSCSSAGWTWWTTNNMLFHV